MKLKSQPKAPKRKDINHRVELSYDVIVFEILNHCVQSLINHEGYTADELQLLSDHDLKLDYGRGYYDEVDLFAEFTTLESDASWDKRVQAFYKKQEAYTTWLVENAEDIAEEIAAREAQQAIDFRNKTQREVDRLSVALAANQKKLAGL